MRAAAAFKRCDEFSQQGNRGCVLASVKRLADSERPPERSLSLRVVSSGGENIAEMRQIIRDPLMLLTERLLVDGQRPPQQRFRFRRSPAYVQK